MDHGSGTLLAHPAQVALAEVAAGLVLLCGHHHRVVHHDGWHVWLDRKGRPVFRPPRWIDPEQHPRPAWRPPTPHGIPAVT